MHNRHCAIYHSLPTAVTDQVSYNNEDDPVEDVAIATKRSTGIYNTVLEVKTMDIIQFKANKT